MNDLRLRRFEVVDIPAYSALFQRVFRQEPWRETWSLEKISCDVKAAMARPGFVGVAADRHGRAAGFLTGYPLPSPLGRSWFYLDQLFVDSRLQGGGVGSALLEFGLESAAEYSCRRAVLLTKSGTHSERFYLKHGFARWGCFIRMRGKVLMQRPLRREVRA